MKQADLQANISVMKQESVSLSLHLNDLHKKIKQAEETLQQVITDSNKKLAQIHAEQIQIDAKKNDLVAREEALNTHLLEGATKSKEIQSELKEQVKQLAKINSWCLQGEERIAELAKKQAEIQSNIEIGKQTLAHIERLSYAKVQLEEQVDVLRKEASDIQRNTSQLIMSAHKAVEQEKKQALQMKLQREQEEINFYNLREKKVRVEHDIEIYISRASQIYEKAFPELEMKM